MADYSKCSLLYYRGQYYMKGTKVKVKDKFGKVQTVTFLHDDYYSPYFYHSAAQNPEDYIIEIVEPIYYSPPHQEEPQKANIFFRTGSGSAGHDDDVFHGFLLYLAVMLGGIIFKDRWLIWIMATIVYFGWKNKL